MVISDGRHVPATPPQAGVDLSSEKWLQDFTKSMLKKSLFVGTFTEKRLVTNLGQYLDVIKIADDEHKLIENLIVVKNRIENFYLTKKWIGFTTPSTIGAPAGHCLWVNLKEEIFGMYWFEIRKVEFLQNSVLFKLKAIKKIENKIEPTKIVPTNAESENLSELKQNLRDNLNYFFSQVTTFKNFKSAVIFLVMLFATLCTAAVHFSKYFLEYALVLIDKLDKILKTLTPFSIAILDVISRAIAGLYTLIALLWMNRHKPATIQQVRNPAKMIGYGNFNGSSSPPYVANNYNNVGYNRRGPTITALD